MNELEAVRGQNLSLIRCGFRKTFSGGSRRLTITEKKGELIGHRMVDKNIIEHKKAGVRLEKESTAISAVVNDMLRGEVDDAETEKRVLDACLVATDSVYGMIGKINEHGKYDTTTYSSRTLEDCAFPEALSWEMSTGMTIRGIWGWAALHGKPLVCNDLQVHPAKVGLPKGHVQLKCFLGVPLKRSDKVVGMVAVANKPSGYLQEDKETLVRLASVISVSRQHRLALIEAKRTSAELERLVEDRTQALKESEENFRLLMEQSPYGIQIMRPDGRIVQVNDAYVKLWELTQEDLSEYNILRDEQAKSLGLMPYIERAFAGETLSLPPFEYDPGKTKSAKKGRIRWIRSHIYPVMSKDGEIRNVVMMHEDVTERKRAEEILDEYNEQLEQVNQTLESKQQELEEFTYTVSHDLKAPVVSIQGFAKLLQERLAQQLDEKSRKYLDRIVANCNNMDTLLKDLLELSRIGRIEEELEEIDLTAQVAEIYENFSATASEKGIQLESSDYLPAVFGRQRRIKDVFANLIDNAIKHMPQQDVSVVEVGYDVDISGPQGTKGAFFVRDNGKGIPKQFHMRIFEMFQRAPSGKDNDKESGSGVGLTIVKRVIEMHGGEIWLKSTLGEGSTFYFTLPIVDIEGEKVTNACEPATATIL